MLCTHASPWYMISLDIYNIVSLLVLYLASVSGYPQHHKDQPF